MISPAILHKLNVLTERYNLLSSKLSDTEVLSDQNQFREFSKEYAKIEPIIQHFQRYQALSQLIEEHRLWLNSETDEELIQLAQEEIAEANEEQAHLEQKLYLLLLPVDPNDERNVYLEIRAAAGGDEAAIFAGDLFRMYSRYAETQNWRVEIVHYNAGEHGGYKEIIARISGRGVYARLKFESGAHRVQRVPETEAQGRVHTSTCTVAILPEADEIEAVAINPAELRIDTFRASGAGGQHVQKTDSAIRITHLPTGIVVECQDERSQHKNRARALSLLQSKIWAMQLEKQQKEHAEKRRNLVGTGDRSERIRTYNFPQGRLTDHRINLTLYKLLNILEGELDPVIEPLIQAHQADLLSDLAS